MNKEITVYELLGLIKDKLKYNLYVMYFDRLKEKEDIMWACEENIIDKLDRKAIFLNDILTITEEDKPIIEKLNLKGKDIRFGIMSEWLDFNPNENEQKICSAIESIGIKLNEVIDYINKKEG